MKKSLLKNLLVVAFAVTLGMTGLSVFWGTTENISNSSASSSSAVAVNVQNESELRETYAFGETFAVPTCEPIEGATASAIVIFPSGRAVSSQEIVLNETGKYTLRYDYRANGALVKRDEKNFVVRRRTYETTGSGTAVAKNGGVSVSIAEGEKFIVNEPIKVSDLKANRAFASVEITPETKGVLDFNRIVFTLIDLSDSSNYVKIYVRNSYDSITHANPDPFKSYSYALAGANNQPPTGRENANLHVNNVWGSPIPLSFWGVEGKTVLNVCLDAESYVVTANDMSVIDLDDFTAFTEVWNGFKGDEVRLEISADNYVRASANFLVKSVVGADLTREYLFNDGTPVINVGVSDEKAPDALVGKEYPLPRAEAFDSRSGECSVSVRVFKDYGDAFQSELDIKNGFFVPQSADIYTAVYTATDVFGVSSEYVLDIEAKNSLPGVCVAATTNHREQTAYVGTRVTVADIIASGGTGELTLSVEAVTSGDKQTVTNGSFVPKRAGKYAIIYTATDYIGRVATYVYNIDVTYSSEPVMESVVLPSTWVGGYTYDVPLPKAYVYTANGKTETPVSVSITVSGQPVPVEQGKAHITDVTDRTTATIKYTALSVETEYEIDILPRSNEEGSLAFENFFSVNGGVTATGEERVVRLTANSDGTALFGRMLAAKSFNCNVSFSSGLQNCGGMRLKVEDAENADLSVSVLFVADGDGIAVAINGGKSRHLTYAPTDSFNFLINDSSVMFGSAMSIGISEYEKGGAFSGFPSGRVKLSFAFESVASETVVDISNICRQSFRKGAEDNRAPDISILDGTELLCAVGDVVNLPRAVCADVINPQTELALTMFAPDGSIVSADDGTKLENVSPSLRYAVTLVQYGEYRVQYAAKDSSNGRTSTETVRFVVENKRELTVKYEFEPITSGKVGEALAIPKAVVEGNDGASYTVCRYLVLPDSRVVEISEDYYDSFIPSQTGRFKVIYTVIDEYGNFSTNEYTVVVSE